MKHRFFFTVLLTLLIPAHDAGSQEPDSPARRKPFSQLNFDTPQHSKKAETVTFEEMMKDPSVLKNSGKQIIVDHGSRGNPQKQGETSAPPKSLLEVTGYLVPSLKGPETDQTSPSAITSTARWQQRPGSYCAEALNMREMCNKARALAEVLRRFSGNRDFSDSQCTEACGTENDMSRLVDFKIMDETKGVLRYEGDGERCTFSLKKAPRAKWLMIPVYDPQCACVPRNCL